MLAPNLPYDEKQRLKTLRELNILDTPIEEAFERITRIAKALFNVPIVSITLVDENRQWFKSEQGLGVSETPLEASFCVHTIKQDDILNVEDTELDARFASNPAVVGDPYLRFYAGYPVRAKNNKKLGTICIADKTPRKFSDAELAQLKDLAELVESELQKHAISDVQTQLINECNQAQRACMIDPLTRLWNRDGMTHILSNQLESSFKKKQAFGIAIADIDHFKKFNDEYGHNIGDVILQTVAKLLIKSCRTEDAVGRWGGEEFIILINSSDRDNMREIVERFRTSVANEQIMVNNKALTVTLTIGLTAYDPKKNESCQELIEAADQALYRGKSAGRNQVQMAWNLAEND